MARFTTNRFHYFGPADDRMLIYPQLRNGSERINPISYAWPDDAPLFSDLHQQLVIIALVGPPVIIDGRSLIQQASFLESVRPLRTSSIIEPLAKHGRLKILADDGDFADQAAKLSTGTDSMASLSSHLRNHPHILRGLELFSNAMQEIDKDTGCLVSFPSVGEKVRFNGHPIDERYSNRLISERTIDRLSQEGKLDKIGRGFCTFSDTEIEHFYRNRCLFENEGKTFRTGWEQAALKTWFHDLRDQFERRSAERKVIAMMNFVNEARHKSYPIAMQLAGAENLASFSHNSGLFDWVFVEERDTELKILPNLEISPVFRVPYSVLVSNFDWFCDRLFDPSARVGRTRLSFLEFLDRMNFSTTEGDFETAKADYEQAIVDTLREAPHAKDGLDVVKEFAMGVMSGEISQGVLGGDASGDGVLVGAGVSAVTALSMTILKDSLSDDALAEAREYELTKLLRVDASEVLAGLRVAQTSIDRLYTD